MTGSPDEKRAFQEFHPVDPDPNVPHLFLHYSYFPTEQKAREAVTTLTSIGFEVEVRRGALGTDWLVLARQVIIPTDGYIEKMRSLFEKLASELHGEYDGWEMKVDKSGK